MRRASSPGSYGRAPDRSVPGSGRHGQVVAGQHAVEPPGDLQLQPSQDGGLGGHRRRRGRRRRSVSRVMPLPELAGCRDTVQPAGRRPAAGVSASGRPGRRRRPAVAGRFVLLGGDAGLGDLLEHPPDHVLDADALGQGVVAEQHPVAQHLGSHVVDVLRDHEAPAPQQRHGPPGREQPQGGPGAGAQLDLGSQLGHPPSLRVPGGHDQPDGVVRHGVMDEHLVGGALQGHAAAPG